MGWGENLKNNNEVDLMGWEKSITKTEKEKKKTVMIIIHIYIYIYIYVFIKQVMHNAITHHQLTDT